MSDNFTPTDFNKFLAELDNENYATDMGFMDLLGPIGYDIDHVGVGDGLGPADGLDFYFLYPPASRANNSRSPPVDTDRFNPYMDASLLGIILEGGHSGPSSVSDPSTSSPFQQTAVSSLKAPTCEECGESFDWYSELNSHHRQLRHCLCRVPGCKERFDSSEARDAHERLGHVEGHARVPLQHDFACADCTEEFTNISQLQNHANEAQHSPLACTCGKQFARLDVLHRHIDSLGDSLPKYPCQFCKRHRGKNGFRRRDHLLQHVRGYHKFEAEGKVGDVRPSRRDKYRTPPVCPHRECPFHRDGSFKYLSIEEQRRTKPFETQSEYTKHMKTVHDYTQFPCTVAGCSKTGAKGYSREKDLIKHRKKEHPEAPAYVPETRDVNITCSNPGCGFQFGPNGAYNHVCFRRG